MITEMEQNVNDNLPPQTLCRTGCGFYGNSAFDGMCSKCYKDAVKRKQSSSPVNGRSSPSVTLPGSATSSLGQGQDRGTTDTNSIFSATPSNPDLASDSGATTSRLTTSSINTASPTVLSSTERSTITSSETPTGESTTPTSQTDLEEPPDEADKRPKKNKCHSCKKKVGLTGFQCRCGGLFCSMHRYSDKHDCTFDYREHGQQEIRKNNPVIKGDKLQKI